MLGEQPGVTDTVCRNTLMPYAKCSLGSDRNQKTATGEEGKFTDLLTTW